MNIKTAFIVVFFFLFFQSYSYTKSVTLTKEYSLFQDTTKVVKQVKRKLSFIKTLFLQSDSSKLARKFIHQHHKELKEKKSPTFVSTDSVDLENNVFKTKKNFKLEYEVFGWYPYWEKYYYKYLNYNLLSTIAYFSYEVDPKTGNAITTHDWSTTPLVDSIQAYPDKKILLTVSNFGEKNNRKFLKNTNAVNQLIENLIQLLEKRKGNGVCIDFEGVAKSQKEVYTGFLLTLSNKLKKANKNYLVYITLPSVNWSEALDFNSINQTVDRFVIMGYDYYGKTSSVAGPVSPLESDTTWEPYNLTTSVNYYLKNNIPNTKLLLALPTYGSIWQTKTRSLQSKVKNYIGSRTFSYIKKNVEGNEQIYLEPISKSAYSSYSIKGDKTQFRQCWFENDSSFVYKTKLIKDKKLAGLGIWALGYDKGYDDIWNVISSEMAIESEKSNIQEKDSVSSASTVFSNTQENDSVSSASSVFSKIMNTLGLNDPNSKINTLEKKLVSITDYKNVLLYTMSFVLFFACVGFVWAMFSPNTRASFFNNASLKGYYIGLMLLLAIVIFRMLDGINDFIVMLIIGFLLGILAFYITNGIVERKKKELP